MSDARSSERGARHIQESEPVGRRTFLGLVGQVVAGGGAAALVAGCGGGSSARKTSRAATGSKPAKTAAVKPSVQRFRSRPDLQPPKILVAARPPAAQAAVAGGQPAPVVITDTHGVGQQGPILIDRTGKLVWFAPLSDKGTNRLRAMNVNVQTYRGEPVLSWWQGAVVAAHGVGHYELIDQRYRRVAQVHGHNGYHGDLHEFLITDRGTALFSCYGKTETEIPVHKGTGARRGAIWYGVVQEVEIATGRLLFQWRSIDHVPVWESYHLPPPADPTVAWDYFHLNSIGVDPVDGNLLISSRNTWTVYKVHRRTGKMIWRLGGRHNEFSLDAHARFAFQHHVRMHHGGLMTIFDNEGGPPNEASQSRGLVLRVDERARTATFVRQYLHHPPVLSPALGSVQPLDGGGAFVGWGDSSWFTEYDAAGRPVLDGHLPPGCISYRAYEKPWAGRPDTRPRIAIRRDGAGLRVYASWNGSTEHRRWRLLAGPERSALEAVAERHSDRFEVAFRVRRPQRWLAVAALDAGGHELGRSAAHRA
ncbi:MAG: arylsulfotransferase family protein [Solirubrobacteraceae bacterium]